MIRRVRFWLAMLALDRLDAEIGRWYVNDGQLSEYPLEGIQSSHGWDLRRRRLAAVARLERAGGRDPHPPWLREPTEAQRAGWKARHR